MRDHPPTGRCEGFRRATICSICVPCSTAVFPIRFLILSRANSPFLEQKLIPWMWLPCLCHVPRWVAGRLTLVSDHLPRSVFQWNKDPVPQCSTLEHCYRDYLLVRLSGFPFFGFRGGASDGLDNWTHVSLTLTASWRPNHS